MCPLNFLFWPNSNISSICIIPLLKLTFIKIEKYKETIKEVTKRNYRKRVSSLNQYLENTKCIHCGENEIACLRFYPHDKEIRKTIKRVGMNDESRKTVKRLIDSSNIVCSNCLIKIENDLLDPTFL